MQVRLCMWLVMGVVSKSRMLRNGMERHSRPVILAESATALHLQASPLQVYKGTVIVAGGYTKEEGNKAIESGAPPSGALGCVAALSSQCLMPR